MLLCIAEGVIDQVSFGIEQLYGVRALGSTELDLEILDVIGPHVGEDDEVTGFGMKSMSKDDRLGEDQVSGDLLMMKSLGNGSSWEIGPDGSHAGKSYGFAGVGEAGAVSEIDDMSLAVGELDPCCWTVFVGCQDFGVGMIERGKRLLNVQVV